MIIRKDTENYQIVQYSEERDGERFFANIGPFAFSKDVYKSLEGPLTHHRDTQWICVYTSGNIVSISSLHIHTLQKGYVTLDNAYTLPEYRGRGFHRLLFQERLILAQKLNAFSIQGKANDKSEHLFREFRFIEKKRRGKWIDFERLVHDKHS